MTDASDASDDLKGGWKDRFLDAIKHLHEAIDLIEDIDSEMLLSGQLKDRVDTILVHRRS